MIGNPVSYLPSPDRAGFTLHAFTDHKLHVETKTTRKRTLGTNAQDVRYPTKAVGTRRACLCVCVSVSRRYLPAGTPSPAGDSGRAFSASSYVTAETQRKAEESGAYYFTNEPASRSRAPRRAARPLTTDRRRRPPGRRSGTRRGAGGSPHRQPGRGRLWLNPRSPARRAASAPPRSAPPPRPAPRRRLEAVPPRAAAPGIPATPHHNGAGHAAGGAEPRSHPRAPQTRTHRAPAQRTPAAGARTSRAGSTRPARPLPLRVPSARPRPRRATGWAQRPLGSPPPRALIAYAARRLLVGPSGVARGAGLPRSGGGAEPDRGYCRSPRRWAGPKGRPVPAPVPRASAAAP